MEPKKIEILNFLARKAKNEILIEEELIEQKSLRDEYREEIRLRFLEILENTSIQQPDGRIEKIKKKET